MPSRCPSCGQNTLEYKGDPLAERGRWLCPCGWSPLGRNPGYVKPEVVRMSKPVGRPPTNPETIRRRAAAAMVEPARVPEHRPRPPQYVPRPVTEPRKTYKPLRPEDVTRVVCEATGVSVDEVEGNLRNKDIVLARELIIDLLRNGTRMSYPDITRAMGGTNHSTAITAHNRIVKQLDMTLVERLGENSASLKRIKERTVGELLERLRRSLNGQETPESGTGSDEARAQGG